MKNLNHAVNVSFGSGTLGGHFVQDDVRVGTCDGKLSNGQIVVKDQKFGVVDHQSSIFYGNNFEAIVGMAYAPLGEKGMTPLFDEMINQKVLT